MIMNTAYDDSLKAAPPSAEEMRAAEYYMSPEIAVSDAIDDLQDHALHGGIRREVTIQYLRDRGAAIQAGDMSYVKRMLAAQVTLLERLFRHLVTRAGKSSGAEQYERYMRLAMRAQTQCIRTAAIIEHLGKNNVSKSSPTKVGVDPLGELRGDHARPESHKNSTTSPCKPAPPRGSMRV